MYDFSNISLKISESLKLFYMRFVKSVSQDFLGKVFEYLLMIEFIKPCYTDKRNRIGEAVPSGKFSLTDKYFRYSVYRRNKLFYGILTSFVTPIIVSIITAILTVITLKLLGLG